MDWLSALLACGLETLDDWPGAALLAYVRVVTGARTEKKRISFCSFCIGVRVVTFASLLDRAGRNGR